MPPITPTQIAVGVSVLAGGVGALILFALVVFGTVLLAKWIRARKASGKAAPSVISALPAAPSHAAFSELFSGIDQMIRSHTGGLPNSRIAGVIKAIGKHLIAWDEAANHREMNALLRHFGLGVAVPVVDKVVDFAESKAGIAPETLSLATAVDSLFQAWLEQKKSQAAASK